MSEQNSYDTPLIPEEEARFRKWAGKRIRDTYDYDLRGFWKSGESFAADGHGSDKYKKPNHPTFSEESQYSTPENKGGKWMQALDGRWIFWASPANMRGRTIGDLQGYFNQVEPGNMVIFPSLGWSLKP